MASNRTRIETTILPLVVKPNRYIGNHVAPDVGRLDTTAVRAVVVHPDVFEIGFGDRDTRDSHITLNALDASAADLAFLPWPDLLEVLAPSCEKLWGLESFLPLADFDLVVFTPATALQCVHLPRLLEAGGLAARAADRAADAPLVALLGPLAGNPEPVADCLDLVLLGEPAAVLPGVVRGLAGRRGTDRDARRRATCDAPGVMDATLKDDAHSKRPACLTSAAPRPAPSTIVPIVEIYDEGFRLEIRRGGRSYGHEFDWRFSSGAHGTAGAASAGDGRAGAWTIEPEAAADRVTAALQATGLDRVDLVGDHPWAHPEIHRIAEAIVRRHPDVRIVLDDFGTAEPTPALARELNRGKRISYTWSPLAGSERLRAALGVPFDEVRFLDAVATAKRGGCHAARFRFLIGIPGETDEDIAALCDLVKKVRGLSTAGASPPRYEIRLEPFVPRPHTPFAGAEMPPLAAIEARIATIRAEVEHGPVHVRAVPPDMARIEALIACGGRNLGDVLIAAAAAGATTPTPRDAWNGAPWRRAFAEAGIDVDAGVPAARDAGAGAPLTPWHRIDPGAPTIVAAPRWRDPEPAAAPAAAADAPVFGRRTKRKLSPGAAQAVKTAARWRIRYAKEETARFTSHLDVGRAFERAIRRLGLTVAAARGRGVKMSFGPPLPLGMSGADEYLDLVFADEVPETVPASLAALLPAGIVLVEYRPVRASVESLSHAIDRAHYEVTFPVPVMAALCPEGPAAFLNVLENGVRWMLAEREILVPKSPDDELNRTDVRPGLLAMDVDDRDHSPVLRLHVMLGAAHAPRPETLLPVLIDRSLDPRLTRIHRTALRISGAGREFTPLEVVELDFPWWRETLKKRAAGQRP